jgi:hypothetical protein
VDYGSNIGVYPTFIAATRYYLPGLSDSVARSRLIAKSLRQALVCSVLRGKGLMSTDLPAALAEEAEAPNVVARSMRRDLVTTAFTVLFATAAVVLVSYFAVTTNL